MLESQLFNSTMSEYPLSSRFADLEEILEKFESELEKVFLDEGDALSARDVLSALVRKGQKMREKGDDLEKVISEIEKKFEELGYREKVRKLQEYYRECYQAGINPSTLLKSPF